MTVREFVRVHHLGRTNYQVTIKLKTGGRRTTHDRSNKIMDSEIVDYTVTEAKRYKYCSYKPLGNFVTEKHYIFWIDEA